MPKYIPKPDDMYETKPCFICGRDVVEEETDTCCDLCKQQKQIFDEDWEWEKQRRREHDNQSLSKGLQGPRL